MPQLQDLTGKKFGKWTVVSTYVQNKYTYCQCICECGKQYKVRAGHLKSGVSHSCHSCGNTRHGDSRSPLYDVWIRIKASRHGCCQLWQDYLKFKAWAITQNWQKGLWVHRKRDLGQYSSKNCYIDTRHEEAKGGQSKYRKLRSCDIPEIFKLREEGLLHQQIATKFNCCRSAITRVLNKTRWNHII